MNKSSIVLILMVSVVVGVGCAKPDWIQSTLGTVDVTGTWRSTEGGFIDLSLELEQSGAKVHGSSLRRGFGTNAGAIEGTVAGDVFQFKQVSGDFPVLRGEMTVSGDEMGGRVFVQAGNGILHLRRVNSSAPPRPQ